MAADKRNARLTPRSISRYILYKLLERSFRINSKQVCFRREKASEMTDDEKLEADREFKSLNRYQNAEKAAEIFKNDDLC